MLTLYSLTIGKHPDDYRVAARRGGFRPAGKLLCDLHNLLTGNHWSVANHYRGICPRGHKFDARDQHVVGSKPLFSKLPKSIAPPVCHFVRSGCKFRGLPHHMLAHDLADDTVDSDHAVARAKKSFKLRAYNAFTTDMSRLVRRFRTSVITDMLALKPS